MESKGLYVKGKSTSIGKVYGKWKVNKQGTPLTVQMYEKGIVETDSNPRTIQFDFDLKFSFNKDNLEIKFERGK